MSRAARRNPWPPARPRVGYAHVTGSTPGIATATATTQFLGRDSNTTNNVATIGTNIRLAGDASVEISDSKDPASAWEAFTYTVTVRNGGPNAGPVNVAIPVTGANVTNVTTSSGTCAMGVTAANCTITALASGASAVINVTVVATTAGTASATATASFGGFDPVTANNSATAETQVRVVADIDVAIAESADPVTAGGVLTYRVTLTTAGPSSGNVHLSVPVTGSTVTGATPSQGGSCAIASGTVTCDFAPMDFSPSTVDILVNSATAGTVTAVATATFSGTDPVTTNNSATVSTTVNRGAVVQFLVGRWRAAVAAVAAVAVAAAAAAAVAAVAAVATSTGWPPGCWEPWWHFDGVVG